MYIAYIKRESLTTVRSSYNFRDYVSFADNRHGMRAGKVLSFVKPELYPVLIHNWQSTSNANNIFVIKLFSAQPSVNIVTVYSSMGLCQ